VDERRKTRTSFTANKSKCFPLASFRISTDDEEDSCSAYCAIFQIYYPTNNKSIKMGGGNAQKSAAARLKNMKSAGKTDEERKAATAKAAKDSVAFVCKLCRQTFMINAKNPQLYLHVTARHPSESDSPVNCFDQLADFDPLDPKGEKAEKAEAEKKKKAAAAKKKKAAAGGGDLLGLLDAGLTKGKGKKKKFGK
jgi:hypothetical protein